jgi:exosortase J
MSTLPVTAPRIDLRVRNEGGDAGPQLPWSAATAILLSLAGLFAIYPTCAALWSMWRDDPLKSIGGLIPFVSLLLLVRVGRSAQGSLAGSWWGLLLLVVTIAAVHLRDRAILELVLSPSWVVFLPPLSLVAVAYTAGAVLLFGGVRLLRAATFPVGLMWFVNPVPHVFTRYVDLPLQHAAAATARCFAQALGQPLTPDQLRLMFIPDFGMFIAPGCNGIRGAVTMGLIALIAGYVYQFRLRQWALITGAAVLLGYVFNFVRLMLLVIYYVVALHLPWLQSRAEMGDYILGAVLFFLATLLLFTLIRRYSTRPHSGFPPLPLRQESMKHPAERSLFVLRCIAFSAIAAAGSVSYARSFSSAGAGNSRDPRPTFTERVFPEQLGDYALEREWTEGPATGPVLYRWATYRPVLGGAAVSIGVSPGLGAHDALICHTARGENWRWRGNLDLATAGPPTSFSAALFNEGAVQALEASTLCAAESCGQYSTAGRHFGLIFSRPDAHHLLTRSTSRPVPVLLRAEIPDATLPTEQARLELIATVRHFISRVDLAEITRRSRER